MEWFILLIKYNNLYLFVADDLSINFEKQPTYQQTDMFCMVWKYWNVQI